MNKTPLPSFCAEFFKLVSDFPGRYCKETKALVKRVKKAFAHEKLHVDLERYEHYVSLGEYLGFGRGYEWERFVIGCTLCTYTKDGFPRWDEIFICLGRGAGKDGLISWISLCLISPYNPAPNYDVDIAGVGEEQALRPVEDLYNMMKNNKVVMEHFFKFTLEKITGIQNGGRIKGHANNPDAKDGLRSGAIIFNELHAYKNNEQIDVFTTGQGKKKDSRTFYLTTNGKVVGGPFDEKLAAGIELLEDPDKPDNGFFYFICRLDDKAEAHDEERWHKANPSLVYKPELLRKMRKEYLQWSRNPASLPAFMTKRMNLRQTEEEFPAAEWDDILATNRPLPLEKLKGQSCVCGIDFAQTTDWAGVNLHFVDEDGTRYDINHAWICTQSRNNWRVKVDYHSWADAGHVTVVDEPDIDPELLVEWIGQKAKEYCIECIVLDSYRYRLMARHLERIGFSPAEKTIKLYRPSDIMRTVPLITRSFARRLFVWGDNPCLRWATNNTKCVPAKRSTIAKDEELEMGNYLYGKIEAQARKTDPFMALVASMVEEERILPIRKKPRKRIRVMTY